MFDVSKLSPKPTGFGKCQTCAYLQGGAARVCFACASQTMERLPDLEDRCAVCDQRLIVGSCPNRVCDFDDRGFDAVWAISYKTGVLDQKIKRYKYPPHAKAWSIIFGRVLVGFLDSRRDYWERFDLIVGSPAYVGPGATRDWDHIGLILERAAVEAGGRWPFDLATPPTIVQTAATESFVGKSWQERRAIAEGPLRAALRVPDPSKIADKSVVVFDDVFTEGFRIREVARALLNAGAADVSEIVLARQPAPQGWT